jgi:hypothetical protein
MGPEVAVLSSTRASAFFGLAMLECQLLLQWFGIAATTEAAVVVVAMVGERGL